MSSSPQNRDGPPREQLWKSSDRKARKQGIHATIYSSNGSQYKGEWQDDKKHGENIRREIKHCIRIGLFPKNRQRNLCLEINGTFL